MAPFGHKENSNESQDRSAGSIQQRNSTASQASNDPSLSDLMPADGFRPAADAGSPSSPSARTTPLNATDQAGRSHAGQTSDRQSAFRNRPSSVAKPHRPHESLTLRHEHNNASDTQPSFARASIASSEGPVLRPDSPYRGPTGPSHPYQMYPQRTLSDAPSSPTPTSTETPPATQQGPTHPYTLYTQSTAEIEETPSRAIPVGFTNLPDNYRRQIGPDGEEAGDLVGPMGHTEELPPYTRYPEIAYVRKEPSNETESISTPSSSTPGVPAIASGAGGIGRATRDPEFSSTEEDLPLDRSRPSVRSQSSRASSHNINTAAQEISEKSTRKEKWQRRAKKKLWGIVPYWAICLVMVGMVFMGIIMGAVIGTVLKKSDDQTRKAIAESEEEYPPPPPKAPVAEVVPLTSLPGDLDDITVGTWGLPQLDKDEAPRKCFNNSLEFNAWSCDIPFRYYSIDITEIKNASKLSNYDLELFAINETDAQFIWGTQPPSVPKPIPLKLVNDTFDMGRGPAWWLNVTYNKTVIVPEANFPLPERRAKRATFDFNEHPASEFDMTRFRKGSKGAVEGDTPWICTWPDTTLEIFIYPNVNASLTETTETGSDEEADYTQPTPPSSEEYPTKAYPKVVKFLERRLSGNPNSTAVCRQVIIQPGWTWEDKKDEDGEPIRVEIVETSSPWEEQAVANDKREIVREWYGTTDNSLVRRDQQELTSCGCLWWST